MSEAPGHAGTARGSAPIVTIQSGTAGACCCRRRGRERRLEAADRTGSIAPAPPAAQSRQRKTPPFQCHHFCPARISTFNSDHRARKVEALKWHVGWTWPSAVAETFGMAGSGLGVLICANPGAGAAFSSPRGPRQRVFPGLGRRLRGTVPVAGWRNNRSAGCGQVLARHCLLLGRRQLRRPRYRGVTRLTMREFARFGAALVHRCPHALDPGPHLYRSTAEHTPPAQTSSNEA